MAGGERLGASFSIDVTQLKTGLTLANKLIRESQSEFKAAAAGMDDWTKSEDGLKAKIKSLNEITGVQREKVKALKEQYAKLVKEGLDPSSSKAVQLRTQINNEEAALRSNEAELKKQKNALKELGNETEETSEKTSNFGETLKNVGKVAAAGLAAIGAGVGALTKSAIENFANYEQLVGGVETLFGAGGKSLEEYAKTAKATAKDIENSGIDWDKYAGTYWMENGGIQGLFAEMQYNFEDAKHSAKELEEYLHFEYDLDIEDAKKAVESYQKAITDDNVQKKYESLMTAQKTMLSNANNAYKTAGMTANEYMENVTSFSASLISSLGGDTVKAAAAADRAMTDISDNANKMGTDMQSIVDTYQSLSRGNFQMLDNLKLGYGGTKSEMERLIADANAVKEANGEMANLSIDSFADMTEAIHIIQNEMGITGTTAKEASSTISGSLGMAKSAWGNLMTGIADENADFDQLINNFVESVGLAAENLLPRIATALGGIVKLVQGLVPQIPPLIEQFLPVIIDGIMQVTDGIVQVLPSIVDTVLQVLPMFITALLEMLPTLTETTATMISQIIIAIAEMLPTIVNAIIDVVPLIVNALIDAIPQLLQASITLLMAIVDALPTIITRLTGELPKIITTIVNFLIKNMPMIVKGAVQLFTGIIKAIPQIVAALAQNVPQIIKGIVNGLIDGIPQLIQAGKDLLSGLFKGLLDPAKIWESVKGLFDSILGGLKSLFGIHSPSKVMENVIGKNLALGIGSGFDENIDGVNERIQKAIEIDSNPTINVKKNVASAETASVGAPAINVYQTNNYAQAHSRYEIYKSKQQTAAAVRLALAGV